jgi:hypothetical protein
MKQSKICGIYAIEALAGNPERFRHSSKNGLIFNINV